MLSNYLNKNALANGFFITFLYVGAGIISLTFDYELYSFFYYVFLAVTVGYWMFNKNNNEEQSLKFASHYSLLLFGYWVFFLDFVYRKPFQTISSVLFILFSVIAGFNLYLNLRASPPKNVFLEYITISICLLVSVVSFLLFLFGLAGFLEK